MRELLSTPQVKVLFDPPRHMLRFVRTAAPYASVDEMLALHERIGKLFDSLRRDRCTLLVDMRLAPLNNDAAFEKPAERARAIVVRGFPRVAVLVRTVVGTLQIGRHLRADRLPIGIFNDEEAALDHLMKKGDQDEAPPRGSAPPSSGSFPRSDREPQRTGAIPVATPSAPGSGTGLRRSDPEPQSGGAAPSAPGSIAGSGSRSGR